jgi:hypothetical protein
LAFFEKRVRQSTDTNLLSRLLLPNSSSTLTHSESLFSIATKINPKSLQISEVVEFFLFMELRQQQQWSLFTMNPRKWVEATCDYNIWLTEKTQEAGPCAILKNLRALVHKLGEIEQKILDRLARKDFTCAPTPSR